MFMLTFTFVFMFIRGHVHVHVHGRVRVHVLSNVVYYRHAVVARIPPTAVRPHTHPITPAHTHTYAAGLSHKYMNSDNERHGDDVVGNAVRCSSLSLSWWSLFIFRFFFLLAVLIVCVLRVFVFYFRLHCFVSFYLVVIWVVSFSLSFCFSSWYLQGRSQRRDKRGVRRRRRGDALRRKRTGKVSDDRIHCTGVRFVLFCSPGYGGISNRRGRSIRGGCWFGLGRSSASSSSSPSPLLPFLVLVDIRK